MNFKSFKGKFNTYALFGLGAALTWSKLGAKVTVASRIFSTIKLQIRFVDGEDSRTYTAHSGEIVKAILRENYLRSISLKEEAGMCDKESEVFFQRGRIARIYE